MIKVDIISGFLGAGKTTFIRKMLECYQGEKVVLIENEFGEVGIDGGFLKDAGIEISELNSGCICCSLVGDFDKNLREVIEKYTPDRIIIEPSGVGKLSDVMASVVKLEDSHNIKVNALVTIVNAVKAMKQMKAFGEFFNNQIEYATVVVLSRSQNATAEQLEACTNTIKELNPKAAVITTPWDSIAAEKIKAVMEGTDGIDEMKHLAMEAHEEHEHHHHHDHDHDHDHEHHDHDEDGHCCCGHDHEHEHEHHHDDDVCPVCGGHHDHDHEHEHEHHHHDEDGHCCCGHDHGDGEHHHHHHADDIFTSWGKETPHKFDKATIENAMKVFAETEDYGTIVRTKGMVESTDGTWIYFDLVDGEYELRTGEPDYTGRLVVIGCDIDEHKLEELFGI